jgi:ferrochelatase
MTAPVQAILLVAHGTPNKPEDVPAYMRNVTSGRAIPDSVMEEVKHRYGVIGRSPLTDLTLQQASALAKELHLPVYVGMRNWAPYIADTVKEMVAAGISHAAVICLAPQNSRTSVGLYKRAVVGAAGDSLTFDFVDSWHDHPLLIAAFAAKLRTALSRAQSEMKTAVPVIFTAHSVPERTIAEGDPYSAQAQETAALVAKHIEGMPERRFAFQSQGMSGGAWIGPTVEATIDSLRDAGHKAVIIQPIGFVCDHVEVLYDIDILFKQYAAERGLKLWRTESLNASPEFIAALAALARSRMSQQLEPSTSASHSSAS